MSARDIAQRRARKSQSPSAFMDAYALGRSCGEAGVELPRETGKSAAQIAGFIEGLAAWRAQTATPRDYMHYSAARLAVAS
ncbi:hypothetical protein ACIQVR_41800 [Streptomyces xanthochromogenes]|uniref:hypothetical protein n=1 Tax=Streptomyces xanthochromogenes TaxID=67384 RepID=UPI00381F3821